MRNEEGRKKISLYGEIAMWFCRNKFMKNLDQKIFEVHKKTVNGIIFIEMPSFKKNTEKNTHALYELRVLNKSTQQGDIQDKKLKKNPD